jgi:hypothetical protein
VSPPFVVEGYWRIDIEHPARREMAMDSIVHAFYAELIRRQDTEGQSMFGSGIGHECPEVLILRWQTRAESAPDALSDAIRLFTIAMVASGDRKTLLRYEVHSHALLHCATSRQS